jgi:outer membrane immunogenic protein
MAADMAVKTRPLPPPVYNWTGCYVAAGGGYGLFNTDRDVVSVFPSAADGDNVAFAFSTPAGAVITGKETFGGRGWLATAQFGCDYQIGSDWVIGAFVDADWSNMRGDHDLFGIFFGQQELRWSWAVGGRIGWLVTPNLLTFFSAGYTQAEFREVDFTGTAAALALGSGLAIAVTAGPSGLQLAAQRYNGYFLGSGVEYAFNWWPGLFWKTEYRLADYGSQIVSINCVNVTLCGVAGPTGLAERIHPYVQSVRSELVWRFNFGKGPVRAAY